MRALCEWDVAEQMALTAPLPTSVGRYLGRSISRSPCIESGWFQCRPNSKLNLLPDDKLQAFTPCPRYPPPWAIRYQLPTNTDFSVRSSRVDVLRYWYGMDPC